MPTDALKTLHTAMLDTKEGYKTAARDAATQALKSFFARMVELREKDHAAIHTVLVAMGEDPDDTGSFMATVHKTVTSMRAAIAGLDTDALSPFIDGEEKIVQEYDAAITEAAENVQTRNMLVSQKSDLIAQIVKMRTMQRT